MARHLCFYNNDTLLQDNSEPGYFTEFTVPADTNLIVCYDDDYKITGNIRVSASSNQDMINYQYATDSVIFLLDSLQNYTQNQTVRAQITVSNIVKDSNNLSQDIQNYLQNCGVNSGSSIDFSTIVTALNSITTALSALTNLTNLSNLSNLSHLANIITAINNKDNQSDIVNELRYIFTQNMSENSYRVISNKINLSTFKGYVNSNQLNNSNTLGKFSLFTRFSALLQCFNNVPFSIANDDFYQSQNVLLQRLIRCLTNINASGTLTQISDSSVFSNLKNIETKLEQNLPFTTIVNNDYIDNCVSASVAYNKKIENIPFN